MTKTLWFASSNQNKVLEVANFFQPYGYTIKSLLDLDQPLIIVESGKTYQENALIKAHALANYLNNDSVVIADDTGLEIVALDDFPGIYSERWKGDMNFHQAMELILQKLIDKPNRQARMITVIAYFDKKKQITKTFTGILNGEIAKKITSDQNGFGYDGFFYLPKQKLTLHEISKEEKNQISHRAIALKQLLNYLNDSEK